MRLNALLFGIFLLSLFTGCGGDSGGQSTAPDAASGQPGALDANLASLLEAECSLEKFREGIAGLAAAESSLLERSLQEAIADSDAEIGRQTVQMQRFSADALLNSEARALRDDLEERKRGLVLLKNKQLVISRLNKAASR